MKLEYAQGSIFGIDSKKHIRQTEKDGDIKEFRSNIGVVVNPTDIEKFEEDYDKIITTMFENFKLTREKKVYKSHEIGKLLTGHPEKIRAFHIGFAREMLNNDYININYFYTSINTKYLKGKKVNLFGEYGRPTRTTDVKSFINILDGYYNVICGWKLTKITKLHNCTFILDGIENIYPSNAWQNLTKHNNVQIIYGGDHTDPLLSTADILIKHLDLFLREDYRPINEDTIKGIVTYDDKIKTDNIYYHYIGNPDLSDIKPNEDKIYNLLDLKDFIKRPIIFVSKGSLPQQRIILENLPIYYKIYNKAYALHASVRIYDPAIDSYIIGKDLEKEDYFFPLTKEADEQFELLERGGANIKKLEI